MTDLELFKPPFPARGYQLRARLGEGNPWFVASDVCGMLGIIDVRRAVNRLHQHDRRQAPVVDSAGRDNPNAWWINESGLYELVIRSDKEEARIFRRWVTSEVLPSIRKTGAYGVQRALSPRELAQMVIDAEDRAEAAAAKLEAARPAIEAHDAYMKADNTVAMGTVAKVLHVGPNHLFARLREKKVLISTAGSRFNTPYQAYIQRGWFEVKVGSFEHNSGEVEATYTTRATPKGVEGIRRLLAQ